MSIEYEGGFIVRPTGQAVSHLLSKIADLPGLTTAAGQTTSQGSVGLWFTEYDGQNECQEDVFVQLSRATCYVAFNSGPLSMCRETISALEALLAQEGYPCPLREL